MLDASNHSSQGRSGNHSTKTPQQQTTIERCHRQSEHAKEPVNHSAVLQSVIRTRLQSEDTPTTESANHKAPPTQLLPSSQNQLRITYYHYEVSLEAVRAMSFYDRGKLQTVWGTRGVSSLTGQVLFLSCSPICLNNYNAPFSSCQPQLV